MNIKHLESLLHSHYHDILLIGVPVVVLIVIIVGRILFKKWPRKLRANYFDQQWKELQTLCKNKATWPDAIINADKLLDEALKKKRYAGKSMGERLVAAQRDFKDNDSVWFGHKLRNKIDSDPKLKLRKNDVKNALLGIRRALKDLGAFKND